MRRRDDKPISKVYDLLIIGGGIYGACASWDASLRGLSVALLEKGDLRIISFYPRVRVRYVEEGEIDVFDPEHLSFFNINTPADLRRAEGLLQKEEPY